MPRADARGDVRYSRRRPRSRQAARTHSASTPDCATAPARDDRTIVLYGARPSLTGWRAALEGRPGPELLAKVGHL